MVTAMKNANVFIKSILLEGNKASWQTVTEHLVKKIVLWDTVESCLPVEGHSSCGIGFSIPFFSSYALEAL